MEQNQNPLDDSLPPFSALTTDEEREMKAEFRTPGIYFVVANPRSFECLPEYRHLSISGANPTQANLQFSYSQQDKGPAGVPSGSIITVSEDSNTVILKFFEDPAGEGRYHSIMTQYQQNRGLPICFSPRSLREISCEIWRVKICRGSILLVRVAEILNCWNIIGRRFPVI
jgi:hypothetical protein